MDQAEFEALMARAPKAPEPAPTQQPQAEDAGGGGTAFTLENLSPELQQNLKAVSEGIQNDPLAPAEGNIAAPGTPAPLEAFMTGGAKSLFETKDFLFGETPPEQRSALRSTIEARDAELDKASIISGFSSGIGQFAIAMVGLGKGGAVAKSLPWFGKGFAGLVGSAPKVASSAKAALAGAVAFDPHEERLSNLIQDTPLANPLNAWLAADPTDSAALGRVKSALESIGLDAAIAGTFVASTRVWKELRRGNAEEAARLVDDMEAERNAARQAEEAIPQSPEEGGPLDGTQASPAPDQLADGGVSGGRAPLEDIPGETPPAQVQDAAGSGEAQAAATEQPRVTSTPTAAAAEEGTQLNSAQPRIRLSDENTEALLDGMDSDAKAMAEAGGWYQAIESGHTFGRGEGIPYVKLNGDLELENFMARVVDTAEDRLANLKGGAVLSDAKVNKVVEQMTTLFNADPAQVLGMIQRAGKEASGMVANMEAGYLVTARMFQDSYALAARISMGDFAEFGSRDAALAELKKRASIAASVYGATRSMTAASGRALRRMRGEFKIDPEMVKTLNTVDADKLVRLLVDTEGNPAGVAKALNPGLLSKVVDWGQFMLINNLVSGPKTQLINMLTNSYMVGARPLERMLGAAVHGDGRVFKAAVKQYTYIGSSFVEGLRFAKKAFMQNDSVLAPHLTEAYRGNRGVQGLAFKPWDSAGSILHNSLVVAATAQGLPTRTLGFVDEAVKQTVYRSNLMARAHIEAVEQGIEAGLKDKALDDFVESFVRNKVSTGFDELGRATDPAALREAQISTFQQELLPGSVGKWLQQGVQAHPALRLVLPFVKTPTNVLRYGWKMTPGLNLLQTEYRQMLLGRMGQEAKMQATGQMMMGGLFMGAAAYLTSQGMVTGGGPKDPKLRSELMATGWQPYSVVRVNEDGTKTYIPYGRLDPIAIPFGIITDLQDALHTLNGEETPDWSAAAASLLYAVSNQFTNKTYLVGVTQAMDAMLQSDSNKTQKAESWLGNTASNFIPFSSALRQYNPDPYLRDARDITDKLLATLPGYSEGLPPRRDAWGDPVRRTGLWSSDEDQLVDREMQRLILESGGAVTLPQPVHNGVDLRDITMSDGTNAFEQYQKLAGHPPRSPSLKSIVARRMKSRSYKLAPDGDIGTKGTKLWILHAPVSAYRENALKMLKRDPVIRDAFRAEDLRARAKFLENKKKANSETEALDKIGSAFGVAN